MGRPPLVPDGTTFTQREACHGIFSRLTAPYNSRSLATPQAQCHLVKKKSESTCHFDVCFFLAYFFSC